MNCVLFAKMHQVFSLKKQNIKKILENGKKYWKSINGSNYSHFELANS